MRAMKHMALFVRPMRTLFNLVTACLSVKHFLAVFSRLAGLDSSADQLNLVTLSDIVKQVFLIACDAILLGNSSTPHLGTRPLCCACFGFPTDIYNLNHPLALCQARFSDSLRIPRRIAASHRSNRANFSYGCAEVKYFF